VSSAAGQDKNRDKNRDKDRVTLEPGDGAKPAAGAAIDPEFLKREAKRLLAEVPGMKGGERPEVVAEAMRVEELVKAGHRTATNGPIMYTMRLAPGLTDTYSIRFKPGEWARITVHAGSSAQLGLKAVTGKGDKRAEDVGHDPAIAWIPQQEDGGNFKVTVTNQGTDMILYQLLTN
jgi:hypothetical protein